MLTFVNSDGKYIKMALKGCTEVQPAGLTVNFQKSQLMFFYTSPKYKERQLLFLKNHGNETLQISRNFHK